MNEHLAAQGEHPPFDNPISANVTEKEAMHLIKQRDLVNILIEHGMGVPQVPIETNQNGHGFDAYNSNSLIPESTMHNNFLDQPITELTEERLDEDVIVFDAMKQPSPVKERFSSLIMSDPKGSQRSLLVQSQNSP